MRNKEEVINDIAFHLVLDHLTDEIEHDFFYEDDEVIEASDEFEDPDLWLEVEKKVSETLRELTKKLEVGN